MVEVPKVADDQQENAEISGVEGENERSLPSPQITFIGYRIRINNNLLRDQLKIWEISEGPSSATNEM